MNPRVVLWARANGVDVANLRRKDRTVDLFRVNGVPWTVEFIIWMSQQWRDFRSDCHGNAHAGECCAAATTDGRFDLWLRNKVGAEPHQVSEPCTCGECEQCTFYETRGTVGGEL